MASRYSCLGSPKKWTLGREGHLQNHIIIFGILGVMCSVFAVGDAWTPGIRVNDTGRNDYSWGWRNSTRTRKQDNFTCEANQKCYIVNITFDGTIWSGNPLSHISSTYRPSYALHKATGQINITSLVKVSCCQRPKELPYLNYSLVIQYVQNCTNTGVQFSFPLNETEVITCGNATEIENRAMWGQFLVFVNINASKIDPGHIKRVPSTCRLVGRDAQKTVIQASVQFPPSRTCPTKRSRRAWYDTLLGGYGALSGTINGFDIETLANRMHNAGSGIKDVLTLQANWMPTIWQPFSMQTDVDTIMLDLQDASNRFSYEINSNISNYVNWSICTLQTIYQQQQKNTLQTMLMTGNEQVWRTVFNQTITETDWIQLEAQKMVCNDILCKGTIFIYNVTKKNVMCKFVVLPLLIGVPEDMHFWVPRFNGIYIDDQNRTHDLSLCDDTLEGTICKVQSAVYEPCLLQNTINVCEWTVLPLTFKMMVEIAPQEVCLASNQPVVPGMVVPFSGCLRNVSALVWENETFVLLPEQDKTVAVNWQPLPLNVSNWDLNLTKFKKLLEDTEEVQQHIKLLNRSLATHIVSTTVIAGKIVKMGSAIADATSHHWYDIFMGYSSSAQTTLNWLIHPVLVLAIVVILLSLWNCFMAYKVFCRKPKVLMVSYGK
ncbi:uncharacterized protein [Eleutherodactylus coqui]|uniref:uncharacterized protein n=2 Tax=Eleutherodactylus coqui TaxID=57060 RepID=UPI0034623FEE